MTSRLISIIIPVHNSEKYIHRCLNSISHQLYKNWELILIDDGSTDGSGIICEEYAKKDERIKVIHQSNQGVSVARNSGLDIAQGKWVIFCDSDDEFYIDSLDILINGINYGNTLIIGGYDRIEKKTYPNCKDPVSFNRWTIKKTIKELFCPSDGRYKGVICSKLFNKDIIDKFNLRFDSSIKYNEDRLFIVNYLCKLDLSEYISITNKSVYKYYIHEESAMSKMKSDAFETDLDAFILMIDKIDELKDKNLSKIVRKWAANSWMINRNIKDIEDIKSKRKRLYNKISSRLNRKQLISGMINYYKINLYKRIYQWKNMIFS